MPAPSRSPLDRQLGMHYYATEVDGVGGVLRERADDFRVYEVALGNVVCAPGCSRQLGGGGGSYVWFLLEKRDVDTVTALRAIARQMGISHKKFSAAGLKDARAVTFQLVSVEGVDPSAVPRAVGRKIRIHDVFTMPFKLAAGMLWGNVFEITVRRLSVSLSEAERRLRGILEQLGREGAPNYYGYQRFGTIRPLTHVVGKLVLQGRFEEAVRELLTRVFPHESERAKEARRYLASTWDVAGALKLFPTRLHHERMILHYLSKHPNDYSGAIRTLPLAIRRLFVEAYQAYLFNLALSKRIEMGLPLSTPVEGDLVMLGGNERAIVRARSSNIDKLRELVERGAAEVVGNVFGYASVLSEGLPGLAEGEALREEGVSLDVFRAKVMPELASRGTVRPLSLKPSQLEWRLLDEGGPCVTLRFALRRGSYATVLLREIVKPEDPAAQGF